MNSQQREVVRRCQSSVIWFLKHFGKIKHPGAGILPFDPFSYQKKALADFRKFRMNIFKKCFAAGSPIWTPDGPKSIENIVVGDNVYTYNMVTGAVEVAPVQAAWPSGSKATVIVRTKTGHRAVCTPEHRYLTRRGWIAAGDLTTNDIIIEIHDPSRYCTANHSEAIILGYLISDGYLGNDGHQPHFTNTNWRYLLEFQKHFELRFNRRLKIRLHNRPGVRCKKRSYRILLTGGEIRQWLRSLDMWGRTAADKQLPEIVFTWNNRAVAVLLNRMLAGDGWYSGKHCNEVGIGSESVVLLQQVKQLLSRFQIDSKLYQRSKTSLARLRIFGTDNFSRFVEQIDVFGKHQRHHPTTAGFFRNRIKGQVLSVLPGPNTDVYDIEVATNHNFVVDGAVVHNCRQSGISKITGAYALWFAMFHPHKTVLIVSRKDDDAMLFMREQIKFLFDGLPEWMRNEWRPRANDHELRFSNNSTIRSLTSHPDVLRSNASSLNVIDEAAFINNMGQLWAGGWSCVNPNSNIIVNGRILSIGELGSLEGEQWQDIDINVQSDDGTQKADKFYLNGIADTYIIKTSLGFTIECTGNHRLKDRGYSWIYAKDIKIGEELALKAGYTEIPFNTYLLDAVTVMPQQFINAKNSDTVNPICEGCGDAKPINYRGYKRNLARNGKYICFNCSVTDKLSPDFSIPSELSPNLAELIGYFVGDGSTESDVRKRFRLSYDPQDQDIFTHFTNCLSTWGLKANHSDGNGADELRVDNAKFVNWLVLNKLITKTCAADANVPDVILQSHQSIRIAFLRGLFEADGWCYKTKDSRRPNVNKFHLGLSSVSEKLVDQVQFMLLDLGIVFKKSPSKGNYENSGISWRLEATNMEQMALFQSRIGFISQRKKLSIVKRTNFEPTKFYIDDDGIFYDTVVSIERGRCLTVDLSVPSNNTYICNGFVSHNTLQHGGSVICISTANGIGNWYWSTWTDAEAGVNAFHPIIVNWWDMDWVVEYDDPVSGQHVRIAPRDGIRDCITRADIDKYGPYWSPWLEEQYLALQEKGEAWKFEQEVLASFIGSGNTVLSKSVLQHLSTTADDDYQRVVGPQIYVHPVTGDSEEINFDFARKEEGLFVWHPPVGATPTQKRGAEVIDHGTPAHVYVLGADTATGKGRDFNAIEVLDITAREQVAELMVHCLPREFVKYIDRIGRWYNSAITVVERNNGGDTLVDMLRHDYMYPRLWRKKDINDKPRPASAGRRQRPMKVGHYGFYTSRSGKATLNQHLLDHVRDTSDAGFTIYSRRLIKQLHTYIRSKDRAGRDTGRTEAEEGVGNFDDLVMALALALVGQSDIGLANSSDMLPMHANLSFKSMTGPMLLTDVQIAQSHQEMARKGGANLLMPLALAPVDTPDVTAQQALDRFTLQLGAVPMSQGKPLVVPPKFYFERKA